MACASCIPLPDIIYELNERARGYTRSGMSTEGAIQRSVSDWVQYLHGVGYRILSIEEIEANGKTTFFMEYGKP